MRIVKNIENRGTLLIFRLLEQLFIFCDVVIGSNSVYIWLFIGLQNKSMMLLSESFLNSFRDGKTGHSLRVAGSRDPETPEADTEHRTDELDGRTGRQLD